MIVYAEAELPDTPVEVSPAGSDEERFHQLMLERPLSRDELRRRV